MLQLSCLLRLPEPWSPSAVSPVPNWLQVYLKPLLLPACARLSVARGSSLYLVCCLSFCFGVFFGVLTWFFVYGREGNMVSIWVWVQKSPGIKTVALMLWKSHLIDALASHLTAFQHLEIRSSEHACPPPFHFYQRPWWVKQLSPVRPEEMVKYWSCSQRFVDSEIINKSELLSRAGLWRGNLCCTNWWFSKVLSNIIPVFTQRSSPSAQRVSMNASFFFFPSLISERVP